MSIPPIIKLLFWLTIFVASAYYFIYGLIFELKRRNKIRSFGARANATIIDYQITTDSDGLKYYHPVFEFITRSGEKITVVSEEGKLQKHKEGKRLTIFYRQDEPHHYYIANTSPFQAILLVFGVPIIICSIYFIIKTIDTL